MKEKWTLTTEIDCSYHSSDTV